MPTSSPQRPTSRPIFWLKALLDLLVMAALVWAGIQAYWAYFKLKIWAAGFGTGVFWVVGLICGFIFLYVAHKFQQRVAAIAETGGKLAATAGLILALLILNPLTLSLALWLLTPAGGLHTVAFWFFFGCAVGSAIVLLIEWLFTPKK